MRRWVLIAVAFLGLFGVALFFWPEGPGGPSAPIGPHELPPPPAFTAVPVQAGLAEAVQALTLTGTVRDAAGHPVPGAQVRLAAAAQPTFATHRCGHCAELLLSCRARESWVTVESFLSSGGAALPFGAETRTDAAGGFRFERLKGVSFTVWATKEGLGLGVKERAAPGEPVELYLPDLRAIVGQLRDEAGKPLAQATVRAISRRLPAVAQAQSDAEGRFRLAGLGEGPFYVLASAPGLLPSGRPEVDASGEPLTLTLFAPRRLEVSLLEGGKPADGQVQLSADHVARAQPTQKGQVAFERLYPDRVVVTARAGELSTAPHAVALDAAVTRVTLNLDKGGKILASAVDDSGDAVKDPVFELLTPAGEPVSRRAGKTGEVVTFGPLGEGQYALRAHAQGYLPAALPVKLEGAQTGVELVLSRGIAIRGRVLDEYGRPAAGVSVLVSPIGESALADEDGRFTAPVPTPGLYELHAHHSDWGGGQKKVTAPADDVVLQLEPRAGARVTVTADGRRVEGAGVVLFIDREGSFRNDRPSGSDGVVLMRGLPAGTYTLIASHPDYLPSDRKQVVLDDGKTLEVSAELKVGAAVKGQVVDTLGAPVSGVAVVAMPRAAEPSASDSQGRFELRPLRKGSHYVLRVLQRGYDQPDRVVATAGGPEVKVVVRRQPVFRGRVVADGKPLRSFRVDDHVVDSADGRFELPLPATDDRVIFSVSAPGYEPLVVDRPNAPDLGDLELDKAPLLTGLVHDEQGQPVADAVVGCDVCEQSVLSGADGRFSLGSPAYVKEFVVVARKGKRTAMRSVAQGAGYVDLALVPGVKLTGAVYLADGRPGAGLELQGAHAESSDTASAVTGPDGRYAAEVAPGAWRFQLYAPGAAVDPTQTVVIANLKGDAAQLDFGPAPGTSSVRVAIKPQRGWGLWLVRGALAAVEAPPLNLLKSDWAQLIFQPQVDRVVFQGLSPGPYTLVWGSLHDANPATVVRVQVPSQPEVSLVR